MAAGNQPEFVRQWAHCRCVEGRSQRVPGIQGGGLGRQDRMGIYREAGELCAASRLGADLQQTTQCADHALHRQQVHHRRALLRGNRQGRTRLGLHQSGDARRTGEGVRRRPADDQLRVPRLPLCRRTSRVPRPRAHTHGDRHRSGRQKTRRQGPISERSAIRKGRDRSPSGPREGKAREQPWTDVRADHARPHSRLICRTARRSVPAWPARVAGTGRCRRPARANWLR